MCGARALGNPPQLNAQSVSFNTMATTGEELAALIEAKGQEIRVLKGEGVAKDTLKPHIDELLVLKAKFKSMTGAAYVAPGQEKKSKPSPAAPPAGGAEAVDPNKKSKKQLQREKKEAEKAVAKAKAKEERERKQAEAGAKGAAQEMCVKRALTCSICRVHMAIRPVRRVLADRDSYVRGCNGCVWRLSSYRGARLTYRACTYISAANRVDCSWSAITSTMRSTCSQQRSTVAVRALPTATTPIMQQLPLLQPCAYMMYL